jgi:hypothetical protein
VCGSIATVSEPLMSENTQDAQRATNAANLPFASPLTNLKRRASGHNGIHSKGATDDLSALLLFFLDTKTIQS